MSKTTGRYLAVEYHNDRIVHLPVSDEFRVRDLRLEPGAPWVRVDTLDGSAVISAAAIRSLTISSTKRATP